MQARSIRNGQGGRKSRLRTSCLECQKRKQKCDRNQPKCNRCARRFPSVQCVYGSHEAFAAAKEEGKYDGVEVQGDSEDSLLLPRSESEDGTASTSEFQMTLFPGTYDSFANDPDAYQKLISQMVSTISEAVISGDAGPSLPLLTESTAQSRAMREHNRILIRKQDERFDESLSWDYSRGAVGAPSRFSISSAEPLHFLGLTPSSKSGDLLQAFLKIIVKYPFSIDGNVAPNAYNDRWLPWSMKSPLLVQLGIFTASCYQAETLGISPLNSPIALGHKLNSIRVLNEMLRNKSQSTSNEAIGGIIILIYNEWYWSNYENVQAHMRGLREIVRLRGGLELSGDDFLRKVVILCDYYISCSYRIEPSFPHNVTTNLIIPACMQTPLVYSQTTFASIASELKISPMIATILDDIRFLLTATVKQCSREPTTQEQAKLQRTFIWVQSRILDLPEALDTDHSKGEEFIYKSCRIAAMIYSRAIVERIPLSLACSIKELTQLWASMWRVALSRWKQIPGIFLFILCSAIEAGKTMPQGRFLKSMFKAASSYMALDTWEVVDGALMSLVKLQRWLGSEVVVQGGESQELLPVLHIYKQ